MKNIFRNSILCLSLMLLAVACGGSGNSTNIGYLPSANPAVALEQAKELASASNRKILIIAGGDWCRWCHVLNKFLDDNSDVHDELEKTFVVVKVYVGDENSNDEFFSRLPEAPGFPHFWVLSDKGELIKSVGTSDFEQGDDSYNKTEFLNFISAYSGR